MQKLICLLSVLGLLACNSKNEKKPLEDLGKLQGVWIMQTEEGMIHEVWKSANDSLMQGLGYLVNGKDTMVLEQVDISAAGNQVRYVVTTPQNNDKVAFTLKQPVDSVYVFENTAHDFPQRVIYRLPVGDSLHASIEGNTPAGQKRADYHFVKKKKQ
jgi:hypothetical protein